jgi:hypothetical protein
VATHFSRLLRYAWVTVGLFLFPGHHTGNSLLLGIEEDQIPAPETSVGFIQTMNTVQMTSSQYDTG